MRDFEKCVPQKRDSGTFWDTSLFWVSGVESPFIFFFLMQKNKKK